MTWRMGGRARFDSGVSHILQAISGYPERQSARRVLYFIRTLWPVWARISRSAVLLSNGRQTAQRLIGVFGVQSSLKGHLIELTPTHLPFECVKFAVLVSPAHETKTPVSLRRNWLRAVCFRLMRRAGNRSSNGEQCHPVGDSSDLV